MRWISNPTIVKRNRMRRQGGTLRSATGLRQTFMLIALAVFAIGIAMWQTPIGDAIAGNFGQPFALNAQPGVKPPLDQAQPAAVQRAAVSVAFSMCGRGPRINCVVDGDTFYLSGQKIRIADINAPEISQPKCSREARLGHASTTRLLTLLNHGPVELRRSGRDQDRYGRKLRTVHINGRSVGEQLVNDGLAHIWRGRKEDWCLVASTDGH